MLCYAEQFGQVLPLTSLNNVNNKHIDIATKLFKIDQTQPIQTKLYTSLSYPEERWMLLKLLFLYKLLKEPQHTYLHYWIYTNYNDNIQFFSELISLQKRWSDIYDKNETQMQRIIIYNQNKCALQQFPP